MNQNFYTSGELDHILAEMKVHHRRDMQLSIDEILTTLDTASPAGMPWKAARRHIQLIEENKFANQPIGAINPIFVGQFEPNKTAMDILILASPCQHSLTRWEQGLHGVARISHVTSEFDSLKECMGRIKPQILLLDHDLPGLDGMNGTASLMGLSPETKIVILGGALSDDTEWGLFKAGVRGCCRNDIDPQFLKGIVAAVQQGELWIRRTLTYRLLEELKVASKKQPNRASLGLLKSLTQREYEIAMCVGNGETNKQIADGLAITERTVKAHLTEIFRKLGIVDRLKLALILAGDDRRQSRRTTFAHKQIIMVSSGDQF